MRVICVNEDAFPQNATVANSNGVVKNGEVYDVINVYFNEGYIWYVLSVDPDYGYWENCFARCSDIDETELIKERELLNA
jgi:hypothetical protein